MQPTAVLNVKYYTKAKHMRPESYSTRNVGYILPVRGSGTTAQPESSDSLVQEHWGRLLCSVWRCTIVILARSSFLRSQLYWFHLQLAIERYGRNNTRTPFHVMHKDTGAVTCKRLLIQGPGRQRLSRLCGWFLHFSSWGPASASPRDYGSTRGH